jgi:hypothetical protein
MTIDPIEAAVHAAAVELTTPECPWHEACNGACEAAQAHARAVVDAVRRPLAAAAQATAYRDAASWIEQAGAVTPAEITDHLTRRAEHLESTS